MNLLKSTLLVSALFLTTSSIFAQDEPVATTSATTFGGSADFYYRYDFANIDGNSLTSFTNSHDSFQIGMASIEANHTLGKASYLQIQDLVAELQSLPIMMMLTRL